MRDESQQIFLSSIYTDFKDHLSVEDNKRVLFSGKFGSGKSTFLKQFFLKSEDDYITLTMYPVNYTVNANEDVFELVKYDLLTELLQKYSNYLSLDEEDFSPLLIAQSYLLHDFNPFSFVKTITRAILPFGDKVTESTDSLRNLLDDYNAYEKKVNENTGKLYDDYTKWIKTRKGIIYERDEISMLIAELISRLKNKLSNKPVILIIDDLDRLDPEHIFRLLNLFSAHYDVRTDINKFGVDKVIFVCDYNNINLMYSHRYGQGADFEGFINKFYSDRVFQFDPSTYIQQEVESILEKKPRIQTSSLVSTRGNFDTSNYLYKSTVLLISDLIKIKEITFRNLSQFKEFKVPNYKIHLDDSNFFAAKFEFVIFISIITQCINLDRLLTALDRLAVKEDAYTIKDFRNKGRYAYKWIIDQSLICFLNADNISGSSDLNQLTLDIDDSEYLIKLTFSHESGIIKPSLELKEDQSINVYKVIKKMISYGQSKQFFR